MGLQVRPEHHHATAAGTNSSPKCWLKVLATSPSDAFTLCAGREGEQQDQADNRAGNQRQQEMRDELAQA